MSEWQPIDTAPKGMKVLAGYFNEAGKWRTVTATYYEDGTLDSHEDQHESGYAPEGWYEESETHEEIMRMTTPTHWQPLPAPPNPTPHRPPEEGMSHE